MTMTLSLPDRYKETVVTSDCTNSAPCLRDLVSSGNNFTIQLNKISSTNQKIMLYLAYKTDKNQKISLMQTY